MAGTGTFFKKWRVNIDQLWFWSKENVCWRQSTAREREEDWREGKGIAFLMIQSRRKGEEKHCFISAQTTTIAQPMKGIEGSSPQTTLRRMLVSIRHAALSSHYCCRLTKSVLAHSISGCLPSTWLWVQHLLLGIPFIRTDLLWCCSAYVYHQSENSSFRLVGIFLFPHVAVTA